MGLPRAYDQWKTVDPADAQFCRCGCHASDCVENDDGSCPEGSDEPSEEELDREYVAYASRKLGEDCL